MCLCFEKFVCQHERNGTFRALVNSQFLSDHILGYVLPGRTTPPNYCKRQSIDLSLIYQKCHLSKLEHSPGLS